MNKLATCLLGSLATALGLALIFTLNIFLIPILGYWMVAIDLIYVFAGLALISYVGDMSIPLIKTLLKREYYRVKFKIDKKGEKASSGFYLKFLASLIVLFKSAEAGYEVIKEEAHILHSKALLFIEKEKGGANTKASHRQLFNVHKTKQRRAASISAGTLVLLVIGSVIVGLLSSLIFPAIYQSRAATYTWTQSSWVGGTSTAVAIHPGDQIGWTEYTSKDDNIMIDGSGNITMTSGSQDMEDDTYADFSMGEYEGGDASYWTTTGGSLTLGYALSLGTCADLDGKAVMVRDLAAQYNFTSAATVCASLCSSCSLPTREELECMCNNKASLGGNFTTSPSWRYWSSTRWDANEEIQTHFNSFPSCSTARYGENSLLGVRCIRTY